MTNNEVLGLIAKDHSKWVKTVLKMGCNNSVAEDLVQEMYLKINRLTKDPSRIVNEEGEVSGGYIYLTLWSVYMDYVRVKKKFTSCEYDEPIHSSSNSVCDTTSSNDLDEQECFETIIDNIYEWIKTDYRFNNEYKFNSIFFDMYYKEQVGSLRFLSKETNISLTSLYNTSKNLKEIICERFGEDYADYVNGDYDKVHRIND